MNIEEAISYLKWVRPINPYSLDKKRVQKAIDMAIKALEQDSSGDLISRQAVLSTIYDNKSDFKNDFAQGFFADKIRDLSFVNPQQIRHWISHYDKHTKEGWYECDRCHTERAFNTDFCPDCGAKMVRAESEDKDADFTYKEKMV